MLRSNNMARAVGRAFSSTYARLEKAAIAAARRNDAMLLYVPDSLAGVYQDSLGTTPAAVGAPIGKLLDQQYSASRLGAERITNGTFTPGYAPWLTDADWSWDAAGFMRLVGSGGASTLSYVGAFEIGKTYQVSFSVTASASLIGFQNAAGSLVASGAAGTVSATWIADMTSLRFKRLSGTVNGTIDNVSVREVFGYHATQPTAANKPTLARIPRKRGPELVANGSFDSAPTGWTGYNGTLSIVSGRLRLTEDADGFGVRAKYLLNTVPGKAYQVLADGFSGTGPLLVVAVANGDTTAYGTNLGRADTSASGRLFFTFVATGAVTSLIVSAPAAAGQFGEFDNISVAEVLEWSNAVQIDGTDDWMDVTFRDYFAGGSYTFVGAWTGPVTGNSSFVLAQSNTSDVDPLCSPLFVPSGSNHVSIFERGDTAQVGISGSSYSLDTLQGSACVELLQTSGGGTGNYKGWRGGALVRNINYTRVVESLTTNKVTLGASQRTSVSGFSKGTFALLCWSANVMPDADRRDIGRFASYLIGEPYV